MLGPAFNPTTDFFFYVLDEAQVAGNRYLGAFSDANGVVKQPVLRPIIRHLTHPPNRLIKVIVSGTGFSLDVFNTVLASGVSKVESKWHVPKESEKFNLPSQAPPSLVFSPHHCSYSIPFPFPLPFQNFTMDLIHQHRYPPFSTFRLLCASPDCSHNRLH